jgi:iron(II)-dependent oxidoreductase
MADDPRWNKILKDRFPLPETIISPIDKSEMVLIPGGEFVMGIDESELYEIYLLDGYRNPIFKTEIPARNVYLPDYYIDRYPVTNYQYHRFVMETGHRKPWIWKYEGWNGLLQPVMGVGWEDARLYAEWAGKSLPTEEQWEKAARGSDRRWWPWGNDFSPNRCNSREYGLNRTTDVGLFDLGVSPFGCYDMSGNVWEMCEGVWLEDRLPMRGGCFLGKATFVRVTCRWTPEDPVNGAHWLGFRCVKNLYK